jgi:hypothetical protein
VFPTGGGVNVKDCTPLHCVKANTLIKIKTIDNKIFIYYKYKVNNLIDVKSLVK